jgi:plasmid stability protein
MIMADLNIRNLEDDVKEITDQLAREKNMSTAAYVRALLRNNAATERQRRAMREADKRIAELQAQLDLSRLTAAGAQMVREARDDYERIESEREGTA